MTDNTDMHALVKQVSRNGVVGDLYTGHSIRCRGDREIERELEDHDGLWASEDQRIIPFRMLGERADSIFRPYAEFDTHDDVERDVGRAILSLREEGHRIGLPMAMYMEYEEVDRNGQTYRQWKPKPNQVQCRGNDGHIRDAMKVVSLVLNQAATEEDGIAVDFVGWQVPIGFNVATTTRAEKGKVDRGEPIARNVDLGDINAYLGMSPRVVVRVRRPFGPTDPEYHQEIDYVEIDLQVLKAMDKSFIHGTEFLHIKYRVIRPFATGGIPHNARRREIYSPIRANRGYIVEDLWKHARASPTVTQATQEFKRTLTVEEVIDEDPRLFHMFETMGTGGAYKYLHRTLMQDPSQVWKLKPYLGQLAAGQRQGGTTLPQESQTGSAQGGRRRPRDATGEDGPSPQRARLSQGEEAGAQDTNAGGR